MSLLKIVQSFKTHQGSESKEFCIALGVGEQSLSELEEALHIYISKVVIVFAYSTFKSYFRFLFTRKLFNRKNINYSFEVFSVINFLNQED